MNYRDQTAEQKQDLMEIHESLINGQFKQMAEQMDNYLINHNIRQGELWLDVGQHLTNYYYDSKAEKRYEDLLRMINLYNFHISKA